MLSKWVKTTIFLKNAFLFWNIQGRGRKTPSTVGKTFALFDIDEAFGTFVLWFQVIQFPIDFFVLFVPTGGNALI